MIFQRLESRFSIKTMGRHLLCLLLSVSCIVSFSGSFAEAKPFKRVLVLSGGGVNPGFGLGVISGVESMGWHPDLIIATCGAGMGATMYNAFHNIPDSLDALVSDKYFNVLQNLQIDNGNALDFLPILENPNYYVVPSIFNNLILRFPNNISKFVKNLEFNRDPRKAKLILIGARSQFGPQDVGQLRKPGPQFVQTYFTDPDTARLLAGWKIQTVNAYPRSTVALETETETRLDSIDALRATIGDPFFLNPGYFNGQYYFTGAVDLYPYDLAEALGDEVVATYPGGLFKPFEDTVFRIAFGYNQTTRALQAVQHKNIKWVDISVHENLGEKMDFNPDNFLIWMKSNVPNNYDDYRTRVGDQWKRGLVRGQEAIINSKGKMDVRWYLRQPINPALLTEFSCKNANAWKTDSADYCEADVSQGCDRRRYSSSCTPLR